jgi:signal transduction histidine kinase
MGEMAATVAHEVNQPLFAIVSNAETALRLLAGESGDVWKSGSVPEGLNDTSLNPSGVMERRQTNLQIVQEALEDIVDDGHRASQIIELVRSRVRKESYSPVPVNLNRVARETAEFAEHEIRRRGLALRLQLADDLPSVKGNAIELQQVILNFLINAVQACETVEESSDVLLQTSCQADHVVVSVVDGGVGIDEAKSRQMFDPFYTTKPEGTGIGLTVSRTIIESGGGRIWASSNHDRGATFHFSLPAINEASV